MIKLDMIGIVVSNMAASLAFYRQLGFEIPLSQDHEKHVEVTLPGGLRFAWDDLGMIRSYDPDFAFHPAHAGAYLCDSTAAVDAKFSALTALGYVGNKAPWDAFWGQRYAQVKDPDDGHIVDLFAPL
jgi:catechol 2,3-dioxygenase-like lactoylglutathione lyase family enzyme